MKREYLVSAKEMQQYDRNTIEKIGMEACVLMERAAYAVAMEVIDLLADKPSASVLILAGNGNNGADGVCAGRILKEFGMNVDICLTNNKDTYGKELQRQLDIASFYGLSPQKKVQTSFQKYDVIMDALFGIGLNRDIEGETKDVIEAVNASGVPVISVDIPSGIHATTGKILGCAIKADTTVTFGFYKQGQMRYPGRLYCGRVVKAKIGINATGFFGKKPECYTYLPDTCDEKINFPRNPMGNKGTFGKVLVIAGRKATTGAAVLCASSALRSGCGMVSVFTEKENKDAFLTVLPEAMIETYSDCDEKSIIDEKLRKWIEWADTIVIGCGLMRDGIAYDLVKQVLETTDKPVVCDADALPLIAKSEELRNAVAFRGKALQTDEPSVIFTPHPGELASLAGCTIDEIKEKRMEIIEQVLKKYPVILIAKDADTFVCANGHETYLNVSGNDGLSTAGSGDVLAGLTASFVARFICAYKRKGAANEEVVRTDTGMKSIFDAVCKSVYLHGCAADKLAKENGKSFVIASDLIGVYKYILE